MKKLILSLCAALLLPLPALAGDVAPGSVPGTLNYQGRLERDNAPVTGPVHIYFRIYNSPTAVNASGGNCGGIAQPCLWESPEITAQATQGIFSADLTPPTAILSGGERLYLEVQVESDTLSPREPLNSVAYAVVAKRLEDGANVRFSSFTTTYAALVSTAPGAYMTVGTDTPYPTSRLTVAGDITLSAGGRIRFPDGSLLIDGFTGTNSGALVSASNVTIEAGSGILFGIPTVAAGEKARITAAGDLGVGTNAPMGKLDVNGSLFVGNEGISDRSDNAVNIKQDLIVEGGNIASLSGEALSLSEVADNVIALTSGGSERARIHSNGFFGVGLTNPAVMIHSSADIAANDGVRGGQISIGDYSTWTTLDNEIRSEAGSHLLLQQTNPFNVGIGTDTPREKLHVRGNILADYGVMATTAVFSGNVRVDGDLDANSSNGNMVYLSSTIVYGSLQVTGGIGSMAGVPAYIASSNTFTGQNTFSNQMTVSSDVIVNSRLGVGAIGFDFPGDDYLQVGGNTSEFAHNAAAYLVAGSTGEARVAFYRGPVQAASLETLSGNYLPNLALVVGGQAKTVTDSVYHRIQNSVVWISTGYNTTPAIFVSSTIGNVGIGISVLDPNWKLTVDGNIRISRNGGGLLFPDGTSITTGNLGALSVGNVSNNSDAVIQSNADLSGGGNVVLRAGSLDGLVLNTGGNVGIGTISPVSRLNVRGGDLVLGTPLNPYSSDSVEDLVVAGNIAFDGELLQRSNSQVRLSGLMVASDVYLSTGAAARTGVGTIIPQTKLEVNGDAQFGSGLTKSTFTSAGALQLASPLGVAYGGAGASLSAVATGGILYKSNASTVGGSAALTGMVKGNAAGAPTAVTGTAGYNTYWSADDTIAAEQYTALSRGGSNSDLSGAATGGLLYKYTSSVTVTAALTGVLKGNGANPPTAMTGTASYATYWSDPNTIAAEQFLSVSRGGTGVGTLTGVLKGNGAADFSAMTGAANKVARWSDANTITDSAILTDNGTRLGVAAPIDASGAITTSSSGTFKASGAAQYSIETASGIYVSAGVINMTSGKIVNVLDPTADQDAATKAYVDSQIGGLGTLKWSRDGDSVSAGTNKLGSTNAIDLVLLTDNQARVTITAAGAVQLQFALGISYGGTGATNVVDARSNLQLVPGTDVQAQDADLNIYAGITPSANVQSLLGAANYGAMRTLLSLVPGTNVQTQDADLNIYAGITPSANVQSLLGAADYGAMRTLLSLVPGTNVQTQDADLNIYAGITPSANIQTFLGSANNATALSNLGAAARGANSDITSITGLTGALRLYSRTKAQLNGITPGAVGEVYYCSDCSPVKVMVSTGTAAAQFGAIDGGNFQ